MTIYSEAEKLKLAFKGFSKEQLDTVIRFGQVAKFRCRNNVAYKNFLEACFCEVADIEETEIKKSDGTTFIRLSAKIK
jgi:hypothetical protein